MLVALKVSMMQKMMTAAGQERRLVSLSSRVLIVAAKLLQWVTRLTVVELAREF